MSLEITAHEVGLDPLDSLPGLDSLCVFVGEDERPLRGAAGFLDWRLAGALSRTLASGLFTGQVGDTLLLSTVGRIAIPRVFAIGLGPAAALTGEVLSSALTVAARVLAKARAEAVALELPAAGTLKEGVRTQALRESFLPGFSGSRLAVLGEKGLAKALRLR